MLFLHYRTGKPVRVAQGFCSLAFKPRHSLACLYNGTEEYSLEYSSVPWCE